MLLLALIGVELVALMAVLPETLEMWWRADRIGDFVNFFGAAKELRTSGLYSPALSVMLWPLTRLSIANAYRVYLALGGLAILAVAFLAQRSVRGTEARIAVALGVLSIPQMHWALRLGHVTPLLALTTLSGFLLLRRHPYLAGLCFALLVLKPQYAPIPALYLLWTRNGRALAALIAGVLTLELVGFAVAGFDTVGPYLGRFFDWGADARGNLLPHQQAWQYAWQGFLLSVDTAAHPLVIFELLLLSLAVVMLAWTRTSRSTAMAVAALGMLLVAPYGNFYDWGLLVVAGTLLLRADVRWKAVLPGLVVGLYVALLVSQQATPFPVVDAELGFVGTGGHFVITTADLVTSTRGIYWVTPAALGVVAVLALIGGRREEAGAAGSMEADQGGVRESPVGGGPPSGPRSVQRPFVLLALAVLVLPLAYFSAAYVTDQPPFDEPYDPFAKSEVLKEIPADFPLPPNRKLEAVGQGIQLPYHVEWTSPAPVSELAAIYQELLARDTWELMLEEELSPSYRVRLARFTPYGFMTHWAMLDISQHEDGSHISFDFFVTQRLSLTSDTASQSQ